jgi:type III secretion protein L
MGLAFLITTDNLQLLSERKVLKENEYAALLDAAAVVDTARKEAARIGQHAEQGAEASRRKGYEEGLAQAKAEYARQLVSDSLAAALFHSALLRVEALLRAESLITVRVAPAQEADMRETLHRLRNDAHWAMGVTITPDPELPSGACVVQTSSGVLEIGVDAQLEAFRRVVAQGGSAR